MGRRNDPELKLDRWWKVVGFVALIVFLLLVFLWRAVAV